MHQPYKRLIFSNLMISLVGCTFLLISCETKQGSTTFDYGTQSDSARHYFFKGWEEILDNGRWTESENAFRKAMEFDPDWILGKSMVGRITRNLPERQEILAELQVIKDKAGDDERLLLDVNLLNLEAANNRDLGNVNSEEFTDSRRQLGEVNFGQFSRKYPHDNYFKAEYIEILNANKGAQIALDTLYSIATAYQLSLGFYMSYAATLELELGNIERVNILADKLKEKYTDSSFTNHKMLKARIYLAQDSLQKAKEIIEDVIDMDPNHMIATGMLSQLKNKIQDRNE